jgi:hypothetical protein
MMFPSIPPFSARSSLVVRGVAALAALLASFGAVGTIDAMAAHYALTIAAPAPTVARAAESVRCSAPVVPPTAHQTS